MSRFSLTLLISILLLSHVKAQTANEALAAEYFSTGEYAKAADIYEGLLKKNSSSVFTYNNLIICYTKLKEFDKGIKLTRDQQRRFTSNIAFIVDETWLLREQGKTKESKKLISELLESKKHMDRLIEISAAFQRRGMFNEALEALNNQRKRYGEQSVNHCEIGWILQKTGKRQEAIEEYIRCFTSNYESEASASTALLEIIETKESYDFFKKEVVKLLQTQPDNNSLNDLLVKAMIQRQDFSGAFIQVRSMDRRNNEGGRNVMELGNIALENEQFSIASQCFNYVINLSESSPYQFSARMGLIKIGYAALQSENFNQAELQLLEQSIIDFITLDEKSANTFPLYLYLGELYLTKFFDAPKAIKVLNEALEIQGVRPQQKAECKLLLGDAYAAIGDPWEAQLLYGQVDKDFKQDLLSQEAKFRNAQLSFYQGDFEWAAAQLEVLKTATSQLISNDAIELGLIIQENSGQDSTDDALRLYASSRQDVSFGNFEKALAKLDSLDMSFPNNSLGDEQLVSKAEIYIKQRAFEKAKDDLEKVLKIYPQDILADKALIMLGHLHEKNLNNVQMALAYYERLVVDYPGSIYTTESRQRIKKIRAQQLLIN